MDDQRGKSGRRNYPGRGSPSPGWPDAQRIPHSTRSRAAGILQYLSSRRRAEPSEEVQVGMVVVPEEQHSLSDDARSLDRAPIAAVAGDRTVVAHHVEVSGRYVKGRLPGG